MKGNNGKGDVLERDKWKTPKRLWDMLNKQYGFVFDCCASKSNSKTELFSSDFKRVKKGDINNMPCWMNPPFSKAYEMFKHFFEVVEGGVAIYRCDNIETRIWQDVIFPNATWIFVFDKRVCYEGLNGKGSRFPSALIGFNVEPPNNIKGTLIKVKGRER